MFAGSMMFEITSVTDRCVIKFTSELPLCVVNSLPLSRQCTSCTETTNSADIRRQGGAVSALLHDRFGSGAVRCKVESLFTARTSQFFVSFLGSCHNIHARLLCNDFRIPSGLVIILSVRNRVSIYEV